MANLQRIQGIHSQQNTRNFSDEEMAARKALDQADSYNEKIILTTLLILDKASFISPIRWLFPTSSLDGEKLVGGFVSCGGEESSSKSSEGGVVTRQGCTTDNDCRAPRVCEAGSCVEPPPRDPNPETPNNNPSSQNPPPPVSECKPGDTRPCGHCQVGIQTCGADHHWELACRYTTDQLVRPCYTGVQGTLGVGECRGGRQSCATGEWGLCENEILPRPEVCDQHDNDCNGQIDEGANGPTLTKEFYPGVQGTLGVGVCLSGIQYCNNGAWETSTPPVIPSDEICDGRDNNCNGEIDERGCGDKIGDPCYPNRNNSFSPPLASRHCATSYCINPTEYEGGYCTDLISFYYYRYPDTFRTNNECRPGHNFRKAVCVQQSQLGIDTNYYSWAHGSKYYCVVTCETNNDCRTEQNYLCKQISGSSYRACLPRFEEVTIGQGICAQ